MNVTEASDVVVQGLEKSEFRSSCVLAADKSCVIHETFDSNDSEPLSPGFRNREQFLDDATVDAFESKKMFRRTLSTIDTLSLDPLSPRHYEESCCMSPRLSMEASEVKSIDIRDKVEEPSSPRLRLPPVTDPWQSVKSCNDTRQVITSEDSFEPWSPGFKAKLNPWRRQPHNVSTGQEPWSPGYQLKGGPWASKYASHNKVVRNQAASKNNDSASAFLVIDGSVDLKPTVETDNCAKSPRISKAKLFRSTLPPIVVTAPSESLTQSDSWETSQQKPHSKREQVHVPYPGLRLKSDPLRTATRCNGAKLHFFEPWSPGFKAKLNPWRRKPQNVSTGQEPWSPGYQLKGGPWATKCASSNKAISRNEDSSIPSLSLHSLATDGQEVKPDDVAKRPRLSKAMLFRSNLSQIDSSVRLSPPASPREPRSPRSPTLLCHPWLSRLLSPSVVPSSPCGTHDDGLLTPPLSQRSWSPEIIAPDPWAGCERRLNRASPGGSLFQYINAFIVVFIFSIRVSYWVDVSLILAMASNVKYGCIVFAAALTTVCLCKIHLPASSLEKLSSRLSSLSWTRRKSVSVLTVLEGVLQYCSAQTFWQDIISRFSDQDDNFACDEVMANRWPLNVDVFARVLSKKISRQVETMMIPWRYQVNLIRESDITPLKQSADITNVKKPDDVDSVPHPVFQKFHKPTLDSVLFPSSLVPSNIPPVPDVVFPRGCHVTHFSWGGRFEVLAEIDDLSEVENWLQLRNVKTFEEVLYPKSQVKKIASENLEPRSFLISKLKDGHRGGMDSRAHLHLGLHFSVLSQIAYADLPPDHPDVPRKGNLVDEIFGDVGGCAEFLKYDRDVEVYYVHDQSLQAVKFESKDEIVIAVRGTVPEPFSKGTWFGPNIVADVNHRPIFHSRYGFVHGGSWGAARKLWCETDLARFLGDHRKYNRRPKKVYFVGHSLGAAIAALLARFCRDDSDVNYPAKRLEIHTFGCAPIFFRARTLKWHQEFSEYKDEDSVAEMRVRGGLVDWDPRRQCEPVKIHHERWVNEHDIVPALNDSPLWKFAFCKPYCGFFVAGHADEKVLLPGMGHGVMSYYDEIKRQISRTLVDTERISVELKKSATEMALSDLAQDKCAKKRACSK